MNTAAPDVAHDLSLGVVVLAEPHVPTTLLETALKAHGAVVTTMALPSDPLGSARFERELADTQDALARVERLTGAAGVVIGVGLGCLTAQRATFMGLTQAAVLWGVQPSLDRRLRALWMSREQEFAWGDLRITGTSDSLPDLRAVLGELTGRAATVPLFVVSDIAILGQLDRRWFAEPGLDHRIIGVPTPALVPPFNSDDVAHVVAWLARQPRRRLATTPRDNDGLLVKPARPAAENRGKVFISYTHADGRGHAEHVQRYLSAAGIRSFWDECDLLAGDVSGRISRALQQDCAGGVLIATKGLEKRTFVREEELPQLLASAAHRGLDLSVFNTIRTSDGTVDHGAPDRLLNQPPGTLTTATHFDLTQDDDMRSFLAKWLQIKLAPLQNDEVALDIQTYLKSPRPANPDADLRIRAGLDFAVRSGADRHLRDLEALGVTLPLVSAALQAATPSVIRVTGGAHVSVALALGGALVRERIQCPIEITDRHGTWGDKVAPRPGTSGWDEPRIMKGTDPTSERVAVMVNFTRRQNDLFENMRDYLPTPIAASMVLTRNSAGAVTATEGMALVGPMVQAIRDFADKHGHEILLCGAMSFPVAVLLGRALNTFSVRAYELVRLERLDPDGTPRITDRWYQNVLDLNSTDSQIGRVDPHISAMRPYASTSHAQAEKRPTPFLSPTEAEPGRHTS